MDYLNFLLVMEESGSGTGSGTEQTIMNPDQGLRGPKT
jgi:hypothetical protein